MPPLCCEGGLAAFFSYLRALKVRLGLWLRYGGFIKIPGFLAYKFNLFKRFSGSLASDLMESLRRFLAPVAAATMKL